MVSIGTLTAGAARKRGAAQHPHLAYDIASHASGKVAFVLSRTTNWMIQLSVRTSSVAMVSVLCHKGGSLARGE
jgi:hypothetical protein